MVCMSHRITYHLVSYRIVSYRIAGYRIVSYRIISSRIISHRRIVSYRIVSYFPVCLFVCLFAPAPSFFVARQDFDKNMLEHIYASIKATAFTCHTGKDDGNLFANPHHQGYLLKKSTSAMTSWQQRFFILSQHCLYYFSNEGRPTSRLSNPIPPPPIPPPPLLHSVSPFVVAATDDKTLVLVLLFRGITYPVVFRGITYPVVFRGITYPVVFCGGVTYLSSGCVCVYVCGR
jgi:hypothetical protein